MTKFYSSKSHAQRAAKVHDVAQVQQIEGRWAVIVPEDANEDEDERPAKQIADDDEKPRARRTSKPNQPVVVTSEPSAAVEAAAAPVTWTLSMVVDADGALRLAQQVARYALQRVVVTNTQTGVVLQTIEPPARAKGAPRREPRKVGTPRPPRDSSKPSERVATMIEMAKRPSGVTRAQLKARLGGDQAPWTTMLKNAAARFGYDLTINKDDRIATYFLTSQAAAAA